MGDFKGGALSFLTYAWAKGDGVKGSVGKKMRRGRASFLLPSLLFLGTLTLCVPFLLALFPLSGSLSSLWMGGLLVRPKLPLWSRGAWKVLES